MLRQAARRGIGKIFNGIRLTHRYMPTAYSNWTKNDGSTFTSSSVMSWSSIRTGTWARGCLAS